MEDSYRTITACSEGLYSEKRSKFIAVAVPVTTLDEVKEALEAKGFKHLSAEVTMIPQTQIALEGKQAESMLKMMDRLEDCDDVQNVYANFDISSEEMEKLM